MSHQPKTPPAGTAATVELIDLSGLDRRPLQVTQWLMPSVLSLVGEALGRRRHGAPDPWRKAVQASLTRRDVEALLPIFGHHSILLPDCLTPPPSAGVARTRDAVDEIAATDPDLLLAQAACEYGDLAPPSWGRVLANPVQWIHAYATAIEHAAGALEPLWRSARPLLDRETERVGSAAMLGAARELLGTLHANGRLQGPHLALERRGSDPAIWSLPREGLLLAPMLGGSGALVSCHRNDLVTHIAYPVPGRMRLLDGAPPAAGGLTDLLGAPRARILRLLDQSVTVGSLSRSMDAVPSAISYHLTTLESAGLVRRERRGQNVLVHRTARGSGLLALYEGV